MFFKRFNEKCHIMITVRPSTNLSIFRFQLVVLILLAIAFFNQLPQAFGQLDHQKTTKPPLDSVFVYNNIDTYPNVWSSEGKVHITFSIYNLSRPTDSKTGQMVRVFRRALSDAEFLENSYEIAEYYNTPEFQVNVSQVFYDIKQAQMIFEQPLKLLLKQRNGQTNLDLPKKSFNTIEVVDKKVELGGIYIYWVSLPQNDLPLGPFPVRVWDPDVVWTKARIDTRVEALAVHYPELVSLETFGYTSKATPIKGAVIGNNKNAILLMGAIHPGESGPELIVYAAERILRDHSEVFNNAGLIIIPSSNPDVRERMARGCPFYMRRNPHGVDCNRNFPFKWGKVSNLYGVSTGDPYSPTYHGPAAGSEAETQAIVRAIEKYKPKAVFSYHWMCSITGHNFAASHNTKKDKEYVDELKRWARVYTNGMYPDKKTKLMLGYDPIDSGLSGWCWSKNITALNLEGVCMDSDREECKVWIAAGEFRTNRQMLRENQEQHFGGVLAVLKHAAQTH